MFFFIPKSVGLDFEAIREINILMVLSIYPIWHKELKKTTYKYKAFVMISQWTVHLGMGLPQCLPHPATLRVSRAG